jgi:hypothetical protein
VRLTEFAVSKKTTRDLGGETPAVHGGKAVEQSGKPAAMGRGAARRFSMGFLRCPAQDQKAAGLRGADSVTIWQDGTVADGRGEVIGNIYDEV